MRNRYDINIFTWAVLRAVVLAAGLGLLLLPPAPQSVDMELTNGTPPTIGIGDSILFGAKDELLAMRPTWKIDAVPGRNVCTAPQVLADALDRWGMPQVVVVELGQNDCASWTKEAYRDLVRQIPANRWMVFVTPWRDPDGRPADSEFTPEEWAVKVARQGQYATWMRSIANNQPNVVVAEWRSLVAQCTQDPECDLPRLVDGSHPTEASQQIFAEVIRDAVADRDELP